MQLLVFFIFIAAVKSGRVDYGQAEETGISNESLAELYEKYGEDSLSGYEPYYEKLDEAILDEPYEEFDDNLNVSDTVIDDSYYRGGFRGGPYPGPYHDPYPKRNRCVNPNRMVTSTSLVTITSTNVWLNTITHSSFHLVVSVDTVRITTTQCITSTEIITEPLLTVTFPQTCNERWVTVTDTQTRVLETSYTNCLPITETEFIYADATVCETECSTFHSIKYGSLWKTNWWTHTLTLHKRVEVSTVWPVTVSTTEHFTDINIETVRDYFTITEEVYHTEFDVIMERSTSTLWVTHTEKTNC